MTLTSRFFSIQTLPHDPSPLPVPQTAVYDEWFVPMLDQIPTLVPHGFIYLRTKADTCARRLKIRNRHEESGVQLDYLQGIQVGF